MKSRRSARALLLPDRVIRSEPFMGPEVEAKRRCQLPGSGEVDVARGLARYRS